MRNNNSKRKISRYILAFCLTFSIVGAARAEQFPIKIFTSADGLASSALTNIFRDRLGFLWFSTRDGLSRFDGSEFTNFSLGRSGFSPTVFAFYEARGDFWIMAGDGLYRVKHQDSNEVTPDYALETSGNRVLLNAEKVSTISFAVVYEDSAGRIWAGSRDGLFLIHENGGVVSFEQIEIGPAENVRTIGEARDGSLWIGCSLGAFRRLPDGKFVFYPIDRSSDYDEIFKVTPDADGRVWIAHTRGIFIIQPESVGEITGTQNVQTRKSVVTEQKASADFQLPEISGDAILRLDFGNENSPDKRETLISDVFEASDGKIWFSVKGFLFNFSAGRVSRLSESAIFPPYIQNFAEDLAGNLWVSTNSGALRLTRQGLTTYNRNNGLEDTRIFSIYENSGGELFIGNGNLKISRFEKGRFVPKPVNLPETVRFIYATTGAFLDGNDWWILTESGLYRFDINNLQTPRKIYRTADGLKGDAIFRAFRDSKNNLWFSTRKSGQVNGLSLFDRTTEKFYSFSEAEGFPNGKSPVSFAEDADGNLWFGLYEGGLVRYSNGRFTDFSTAESLPAGGIFGLLMDAKKRLWLASSGGGVAVIDDTRADKLSFKLITTEQGLATNNARSLIDDLAGNIYVGTVSGIDRITPESGQIKHFSTLDGLSGDFVSLAYRDRRGALWFGTSSGLSKLEPQADFSQTAPEIFISGLQIAGVRYTVSGFGQKEVAGIGVPAAENNLDIKFLSVGAGEHQRFQYKIEEAGGEQNWSPPTDKDSINLAKLAPGSYKFSVQAVNALGVASEIPAVVSFKIAPPFWQSWWFRSLVACLVVLTILAIERTRAARLRALKNAFGKLSVSENRFRQMNEQSPLGIVVFAPDGSLRSVNRAYEDFWGIRFEQIKNWDFLADEQIVRSGVAGNLRRVFQGETVTMPPTSYDPQTNGANVKVDEQAQARWIQSFAYPVKTDAGELLEVILVMEDITDTKRAGEIEQKAKTDRLRELEQVRRRIAADLHDDIGSSLTQISVWSEVLQQRVDKSNGRLTEPLEFIAGSSRELVDAMSDIVWAINPHKDFFSELSGKMHRFAADVFTARDIAFTFDAPHFTEELALGANLRREVFLIFKESVNNIVKHAKCSTVEISLTVDDGEIRLSLHDDGAGFDVSKTNDGHGLVSMKQRAAGLGGTLSIVSGTKDGTTTMLRAPFGVTNANEKVR